MAAAQAKIGVDGAFELKVRFDVLAYCLDLPPTEVADGPMNALLDGPASDLEAKLADAKRRFLDHLEMLGGGSAAKVETYAFPTAADVRNAIDPTSKQRLPIMVAARITGHLPTGSKSTFQFPDSLGTVVLTTEFPYEEPVSEPVEPGSSSTPLTLPTAAQIAQAKALINAPRVVRAGEDESRPAGKAGKPASTGGNAQANDKGEVAGKGESRLAGKADKQASTGGTEAKGGDRNESWLAGKAGEPPRVHPADQTRQLHRAGRTEKPSQASVEPPLLPSQALPWYEVFPRYIKMGFLHILPQGLDHILFVLGLFLLSTRTKDLLKQITAFTAAHSLTLGLSLYGVVQLPSSIVEPIIALSIVFIAVENLVTTKMHRWRVGVVFLFGLVHGLGFASALKEAGLSRGDFLTALLGFNSGVELGQLTVVAGAFMLVGWFRSNDRYRNWVTVPASLAIALIAAVWTIERIV